MAFFSFRTGKSDAGKGATDNARAASERASERAGARAAATAKVVPKVVVGHLGTTKHEAPKVNATPAELAYWEAMRKMPTAQEKRVGEHAIAWLHSLPLDHRPQSTCQRYPHVVNNLARQWGSEPATLAACFEDLLNPNATGGRKQRAGFPEVVKLELERLRALARAQGRLA